MEGKAESVMRAMNFTLNWNSRAFPNKADFTEIIGVHLMSTKKKIPLGQVKKKNPKLGTENYANKIWAEIKWIWKIT